MKRQVSIITYFAILITLVLHTDSPAIRFNYTTIGHPGASSKNAYGINDFGQMFDRYMITVGEEYGFIYEGDNFMIIDYLSYGTAFLGINDSGQMVGENDAQFGFLEYDTTFSNIEDSEDVLRTDAAGINDAEEKPWIHSISTVRNEMTLPSPTDVISGKKEPPSKTELQIAVAPSPKITPSTEAETEKVDERSLRRENWILSQDATYYTLQILGSHYEEDMLSFIKKNQLLKQNEIAYYQSTFNGKTWYKVFYGIYPTKKEAQLAINQLPENIRKTKPWIRSISTVQKEIRVRSKQ